MHHDAHRDTYGYIDICITILIIEMKIDPGHIVECVVRTCYNVLVDSHDCHINQGPFGRWSRQLDGVTERRLMWPSWPNGEPHEATDQTDGAPSSLIIAS